jgi:hypothetical protein
MTHYHASQENRAEHSYQQEGDEDDVVTQALPRHKRIIGEVYRRVGSRESDRDHEVGCDEAQQDEHHQLARPKREQTF